MMAQDSDIVRRILRVNHAGEHGAIAIYESQRAVAERWYPDLIPWLDETLAHERRHRAAFRDAMSPRRAKACRAMFVWSIGGAVLGRLTAWAGRSAIMACTSAVERTVHRHLIEQQAFLKDRDDDLARIIRDVQVDEDAHLDYADARHDRETVVARVLASIVSAATEAMIFLSTRGDSLRLSAAMRSQSQ